VIIVPFEIARSILHGYFNPLVFWYQWEYLLTSKEFNFFAGHLRLAMIDVQSFKMIGTDDMQFEVPNWGMVFI